MNNILNLFDSNIYFRLSLLFILGACIGSFLNVVIFRLPIMLSRKWRKESLEILEIDNLIDVDLHEIKQNCPTNSKEFYDKVQDLNTNHSEKFNLLTPASHCFACKLSVPLWANIPILGFFFVRGKCTKCGQRYSMQYPAVELICAILFTATGYINADAYMVFVELIFISIIICAVFIDYKTFLLPDELTLPLLWIGLLVNLHGIIAGSLASAVVGAASGYLILWIIYWIFKLITRRDGIGYGDFKFLAALLAWVGINGLIPILLFAPLLGIIYFVIAYVFKRVTANNLIPFGPFLGVSGIVVLLFSKYFMFFRI